MADVFDDPALKEYLKRAQEEMFPMMKDSAMNVVILNANPDIKLCLEVGAAVLFDKPIILLVPEEMPVPANLKRLASSIINGSPDDPRVQEEMRNAISAVIRHDCRARRKTS